MSRPQESATSVLGFGDFVLDLRAGELYRNGGDRLLLPDQPFRLLATLVRRPGELVTREDLRHELWADDTFVDFDHGLNSAIKRLREALGETATAPRYIETLPRRGYRFIAPVNALKSDDNPSNGEVQPAVPAAAPITPDATEADVRKRPPLRAWLAVAAMAASVIVAGFLASGWITIWPPAPPVIAVLPFDNLSPETDGDWFVDGLADEIRTSLGLIQGLQVRSRTSSMAFKDTPRNLRDVGKQLGVTLVVEGAVLGSGTRKRINVQMVDVANDVTLWARQFEPDLRSSNDVVDILEEISRAVVNELRLTLGRGQRRYDLDLATYELFLKGRVLVARRGIPSLEEAAELFQQVIARDSAFAPAYAGLANVYALMAAPTSGRLAFKEVQAILRPAAEKAYQEDPLLAEALVGMGWVYSHEHDWANAENAFRRAIELNPSLTQTYTNFSISTLQPLRRFDEALRILRVALQNDPLSLELQREIGTVQLYAARYSESIETLKRVVAVDRKFPFAELYLARALTFAGRPMEAIPLCERIDGSDLGGFKGSWTRTVWLAKPLVMTGRRAEAETLLVEHRDSASSLAVIYAALGDKDRMFDALEQMAVVEPHHIGRILLQPEIAANHDDPRFAAFRARFNLPVR